MGELYGEGIFRTQELPTSSTAFGRCLRNRMTGTRPEENSAVSNEHNIWDCLCM